MRYRKKPVVIDAVLLTEQNIFEVVTFIDGKKPDIESNMASDKWEAYCSIRRRQGFLYIETLEGAMRANFGDYVIKGVDGEFYPCKPDIFKKTYEAVI